MHLLYLKIKNGIVLKNILETFAHSCKIINLTFSSDGISIAEKATEIEINTTINSNQFSKYHFGFKQNEKAININLKHAIKILKAIKKKQLLEVFILEEEPCFVHFKIYNNNFISTNSLKILSINQDRDSESQKKQYPEIIHNKDEIDTTSIKSILFVKSLKEILQLSTSIDLKIYKNEFLMSTKLSGIYSKSIAYKLNETSKKNKTYTFPASTIKSLLKSNNLSQIVFISFYDRYVNLQYKNDVYNLHINLMC